MQKYQVFIDEHFISFSEDVKSNQQFETVFELIYPDADDIKFIVKWLSREKDTKVVVRLIHNDIEKLWDLFKAQLRVIEASGGLVKNNKGEYLFIHRLGKWDLPKGKMEEGESPEESALREVEEECGISELKINSQLQDTYHIYYHKKQYILKRTYWFAMNYSGSDDLVPQEEEAIEEAIWVKPANVEMQLSNTYASLKPIISQIK